MNRGGTPYQLAACSFNRFYLSQKQLVPVPNFVVFCPLQSEALQTYQDQQATCPPQMPGSHLHRVTLASFQVLMTPSSICLPTLKYGSCPPAVTVFVSSVLSFFTFFHPSNPCLADSLYSVLPIKITGGMCVFLTGPD